MYLVLKHGDDALDVVRKYGDEAVDALKKYGDDIVINLYEYPIEKLREVIIIKDDIVKSIYT